MGPAPEFAHGELLASVAEAEARYVVKDHATEYEMPRMKARGLGKVAMILKKGLGLSGIGMIGFLFFWEKDIDLCL